LSALALTLSDGGTDECCSPPASAAPNPENAHAIMRNGSCNSSFGRAGTPARAQVRLRPIGMSCNWCVVPRNCAKAREQAPRHRKAPGGSILVRISFALSTRRSNDGPAPETRTWTWQTERLRCELTVPRGANCFFELRSAGRTCPKLPQPAGALGRYAFICKRCCCYGRWLGISLSASSYCFMR
jgi:hypothetical protein